MGSKLKSHHRVWLLPGRATVRPKLIIIYLGLHEGLTPLPRFSHFLCKQLHPLVVSVGQHRADVALEHIIVIAANDWDDKYLCHEPFKRSRISLLPRKEGRRFSLTGTGAPLRGFRPIWGGL